MQSIPYTEAYPLRQAVIPQCDSDNDFKPMQCHEGQCWCVDKYGYPTPGSLTKGVLYCDQFGKS